MLATALLAALAAPACDFARAEVAMPGAAPVVLRVEVADSPAERAQGLMGRRSLAPGDGMLFVYPEPQPVAFWMRNTLIPLDILFFDAEGRLALVHPKAVPLDETPIPGAAPGAPDPDRLLVLELAGGEAERLGLKPGAVLRHPSLDRTCGPLPPD